VKIEKLEFDLSRFKCRKCGEPLDMVVTLDIDAYLRQTKRRQE
jgi:hypothetical protein